MTKRWESRLLAGCFSSVVALGAASCAVSPETSETISAPTGTPQSVQVSISSGQLRGMSAVAHAARQAEAYGAAAGHGVGLCNQGDSYEKNDKRQDASDLPYSYVSYSPPYCEDYEWCDDNGCYTEHWCEDEYSSAYAKVDAATICKNDDDWYLLATEDLPFNVGYLGVRAFAAGASYCGFEDDGNGDTSGYDPPSGPENTLVLDVYNAQTLALVATSTSPVGRVWMNLHGAATLSHDLYFHFHGPKEAKYDYKFYLSPQTTEFEDECE
jgi:hypothetical protein